MCVDPSRKALCWLRGLLMHVPDGYVTGRRREDLSTHPLA